MKPALLLLCLVCFFAPSVSAEQVVERQGWRVLSFDVPGMEMIGSKDGKTTRTTFRKKVGSDDLKISVTVRAWMGIDKYESTYREEKTLARASGDSRLREEFEVAGAGKVLTYSSTSPFEAEIIVVYSKDFRAQLTVTGRGEAKAEVEATYQKLKETLLLTTMTVLYALFGRQHLEAAWMQAFVNARDWIWERL